VRIALKIAMKKSKENAKCALTLQINWSCAKPIKTCIRFRFAQTKTDLRQLEHSKQLKSSRQLPRTLTALNVGFKWL